MAVIDATERAFLEDIADNPDEDAPRLVFADWLAERGGADDLFRSELIRVQVERARLAPLGPAWKVLGPRAEGLMAQARRLLPPLPPAVKLALLHDRGLPMLTGRFLFFSKQEMAIRAWLAEHGSAVPFLYLQAVAAHDAEAFHAEWERGLPRLQLAFNWGAAKDAVLERAGRLRRLVRLVALRSHATDAGLAALAGATGLRTLVLESEAITDQGLAHSARIRSLHGLHLICRQASDDGLAELAALPGLRRLGLPDSRVGTRGLAHLRGFGRLTSLNLDGTGVDDAGAEMLGGMAALEELSLKNTKLTDAGMAFLKRLPRLRQLNVSGTAVTEAGKAALREALPRLQV